MSSYFLSGSPLLTFWLYLPWIRQLRPSNGDDDDDGRIIELPKECFRSVGGSLVWGSILCYSSFPGATCPCVQTGRTVLEPGIWRTYLRQK
uniref:Putative secreted protein n=1 Tax=Anopheles marajoara TaxID=58244 RepID=A0A2M4CB04_9DIPT